MKPTIGRIVLYTTTAHDQKMINEHPLSTPQEVSPAIIVSVDDDTVNLKVLTDGPSDLYKKGVEQGDEPGQWNWPVIGSEQKAVNMIDISTAPDLTEEDEDAIIAKLLSIISKAPQAQVAKEPTNVEFPVFDALTQPETKEPESKTPLVTLDHETGKHVAAANPKATKKVEAPIIADEGEKPLA